MHIATPSPLLIPAKSSSLVVAEATLSEAVTLLAWAARSSRLFVHPGSVFLAGSQARSITRPLPRSRSQQTCGINYSLIPRSSAGKALSILHKNFPAVGNPCLLLLLLGCSLGHSPLC